MVVMMCGMMVVATDTSGCCRPIWDVVVELERVERGRADTTTKKRRRGILIAFRKSMVMTKTCQLARYLRAVAGLNLLMAEWMMMMVWCTMILLSPLAPWRIVARRYAAVETLKIDPLISLVRTF